MTVRLGGTPFVLTLYTEFDQRLELVNNHQDTLYLRWEAPHVCLGINLFTVVTPGGNPY